MKLLFLPVSVIGGIIAGTAAKKLFELTWGLIDDEQPPDANHRYIDYRKLLAALVLEGAIFRLVRGAFDHASRQGFVRLTGTWPGEESPQQD
jgi:hypothetical protein